MNEQKKCIHARRDLLNFVICREATALDDEDIMLLLSRSDANMNATNHCEAGAYETLHPSLLRAQGKVLLLEIGYRVIGALGILKPENRLSRAALKNTASLEWFTIDPEFQHVGVGSWFFEKAKSLAAIWQPAQLSVHIPETHQALAEKLKRSGFERAPQGDQLGYFRLLHAYTFNLKNKLTETQIATAQ